MEGTREDNGAGLAAFLRREQDRILAAWLARVRVLPPARGLSEREVLDHVPQLLDRIAAMVDDLEAGRPIGDAGSVADEHALERLDEGYDLEQVVREFVTLRQCVLDLWARQPMRSPATPILNRAIDEALLVAVSRYGAARERTLVALDRIGAATLRSVDLDQLLTSLTDVLLETNAAVDSVAIYLRHGSQLVQHASVGLEVPEEGGAPLAMDDRSCVGIIATTGEPLELREVSRSPNCPPALRAAGARAFYGVPMWHDGGIVGVAHVSSRSAYEFSREDKLVFRSMVERASTAIVQRQLQDTLADERRRLATVLDVLPAGVWVGDRDGRIVLTNRAASEVWGGDVPAPDQISGYGTYRARFADGRPVTAHDWGMARAVERGESTSAEEIEIERFDGTRAVVLLSGRPIRDEKGDIVGGVTVNLDITARKAAEEQRLAALEREKQARAVAENAAATLDAVFAAAPIGLAFLDLDGRYVRVNETLALANGRPAADHVGRTVPEVLPDGGAELAELVRKVARTGEPVTGLEISLAPPSTPDRVRDWQMNIYPIRLADGRMAGIGAAAVEITALKQALRTRDEFLGMASHELKSPLTGLGLQLDMMERRIGSDDARLDRAPLLGHVGSIRKLLDRLRALLSDLLDVSRIETGELSIEPAEVDLAELVRSVVERLEDLLAHAGCPVQVDVPDTLVGSWDALRLDQVLTNLLTNVARYAPGQPVHVVLRDADGHAELTVRDHGPGIAPEDQGRVFQRFERVGHAASGPGTGLGLWIVRKIVERMGGTIGLESRVGEGCTFRVTIPVRHEVSTQVPDADERDSGPAGAPRDESPDARGP